jgi:hypothetical protein
MDEDSEEEVELSPILATQRLDPSDDFNNLIRLDQVVLARLYGEKAFTTTILINNLDTSVVVQCQALSTIGAPSAPEIIKLAQWDDLLEEVAMLIEMDEKDHMMHNIPRAMDCVDDGTCTRGGIRLFLEAAPWDHPKQHNRFNQELLRPFGDLHRSTGSVKSGSQLVTRVVRLNRFGGFTFIYERRPADPPTVCQHDA